MPGFLAGLLAPLAGLGTAAKAAIAAVTAAVTMTVAGGATGVLPIPGVHTDSAAVVQKALPLTPTTAAAVSGSASTQSGGVGAQTGVSASVTVPTVPAVTHAVTPAASAAMSGSTVAPASPQVTTPTLPTLPALPACVQNLIPAKGTMPDPATILAQLPACIQSIIAAHMPAPAVSSVPGFANLPANVSKCLSAVFAVIPNVGSGKLTSFSPTSLDPTAIASIMAACVPTGVGSMPGGGSIPGLGALTDSTTASGSATHK